MNKIIGRKPLLEALEAGKEIERVIIAYNQHGRVIEKIIVAAKKRGIKISKVSAKKFKEFEDSANTQGVIGILSKFKFYSIDEVLDSIDVSSNPLILLLDSIQDPHNLGAILRTAEAVGVDAVISTIHKSAPFSDIVEKTSTGAMNHLKICRVNNLSQTIDLLKKKGFWIFGTSLEAEKNFTEADYNLPAAIVVGNEGSGIRLSILDKCDFLVKIPMSGKVQSLNVSVSTGVILYEVLKQREKR